MNEKKQVILNGPSPYSMESDDDRKRRDICNLVPAGQDPLIYWHQVAMDAIDAQEKTKARHKDEQIELEKLKYEDENRKVREKLNLERRSVENQFRILLNRVSHGDFSMDVTLSFHPATQQNGERGEYSGD